MVDGESFPEHLLTARDFRYRNVLNTKEDQVSNRSSEGFVVFRSREETACPWPLILKPLDLTSSSMSIMAVIVVDAQVRRFAFIIVLAICLGPEKCGDSGI